MYQCECGSKECWSNMLSRAGQKSADARQSRSKNEMYFCELCEKHFNCVLHNIPMFNGWDADVIIEDVKIAVLWNGPWHYLTVMPNQKSSLLQIQNRDKIKIVEIQRCGYTPYVIKDMGRFNKDFVEAEFQKFLQYISQGGAVGSSSGSW